MADNESNLEYRVQVDFSQPREQIISIQEALRNMEQIGLAAFISIEDRAKDSASVIVNKFAETAKQSGVQQIATEVQSAMKKAEASTERLSTAAAENLATVAEAIDEVRQAAEKLDDTTRETPDQSPVIGWFDEAVRITDKPSDWVREKTDPPDMPPIDETPVPDIGDIGAAGSAGEAAQTASEGFNSLSASLGLSGDEAKKADAIYARLLAQELKLISSGDDLTRSFVARLSAQRPEADFLEDAARLTSRLTEEQIREAEARAKLGAAIEYAAGIQEKDDAVRQNALDVIDQSISALEEEDETRRRLAAEAKAAAIDQITTLKQVGATTRESLGQQVDAQIAAADAATAAEQEATRRKVEASRERIAADRDATIAIAGGREAEAQTYQETAQRAAEAEERASADIRTAVDARAQAYQQAEAITRDAEAQSVSDAKDAAEKRIAAEKAAIRETSVGRKEAAEIQKAAAKEATAAEQQATASQVAAVRARQSVLRQAAQSEASSLRLQTAAVKDAAQQRAAAEQRIREEAAKTAKARDAAARLFQQTVKQTFPQEAEQLNNLVERYGSFTVAIRQNAQAMNELEREVQDIILANPKLAREVELLNQKVGDFTVSANRTSFRGGGGNMVLSPDDIRKAGFALERFGITGVAAFGEIFAAVGPAGIAIGAVIVSIVTLTKLFSNLARAGVQAFEELISKSVEAGRQTEVTQAQFEAFFKGIGSVPDAFAASEATLKRLGELSVQYGQDFTQLGRALIPNVSGLDQLEEAVKLAASLATIDPTAGIDGAKEAIRSGLGGDLTPLYKRFEIPKATIDRIRELQEEVGATEGLILGLGEYFRSTGQDIDSLSGTANVAIGRATVLRQQFERTTGAPIVQQIKESLNELFQLLDGRENDIFAIADAIGRAVASILELVTGFATDFLGKMDTDKMRAFVFDVRDAVDALLTLLATVLRGGDDTAGTFDYILGLVTGILDLTEAWAAGAATVLAVLQTVSDTMLILISQAALFALGLAGSKDALAAALRIDTGAEIAGAWERNIAAVQGFVTRSQEAREENEAFADSLERGTDAAEESADAALQLADARRKLDEVNEQLAESHEKVAEAREEYDRDKSRAEIEMEIDQTRKLTEALIENARKRVEAALENVRKIQEIYKDYKQDVEDAERELGRDREDIARDEADKLDDIAKDSADERLKIEQDYLRKLEDLKRKFAFDSQEAIRANDAIAYLRLQRKLMFDLEQAKIDRDRKLEDVDDKELDSQDEAAKRRERARRDAQIDYDRKLEDLRIALNREIQEQANAYQQELIDLAIAEQQKRDDLNTSFAQQKEDFDRNWREKLTDLERNLSDEFDLIAANERRKRELLQQSWEAERRLLREQAQERQQIIDQQNGTVRPRYGDQNGGFSSDYDQGEGAGSPSPRGGRPNPNYNFTDEEVAAMRQRARDLARSMGNDELLRMISSMTVQQLVTLLRSAGIPLRDSGGHVRAGEPVGIGKPEILIPGSAGFIYPLDMLRPLISPPVTHNTTNNNHRADVNLSMLDPSMVDLQRYQIMRQMMKEVLADVLQ